MILVKRLRQEAALIQYGERACVPGLLHEAAAEIERLIAVHDRADIRKHDDKCGRVLWHLHNVEVSVGKAAEWMREYIQTGKEGPLPPRREGVTT